MGVSMGKVFGRRVLVQPIEPNTKALELEKEGLLYRPANAVEATTPLPSTGIVIQLGEELIREFLRLSAQELPDEDIHTVDEFWPLRPGDYVMFSKYGGTEIAVDKETYRVLLFEEIMCTLEVANPEAYAVVTD